MLLQLRAAVVLYVHRDAIDADRDREEHEDARHEPSWGRWMRRRHRVTIGGRQPRYSVPL